VRGVELASQDSTDSRRGGQLYFGPAPRLPILGRAWRRIIRRTDGAPLQQPLLAHTVKIFDWVFFSPRIGIRIQRSLADGHIALDYETATWRRPRRAWHSADFPLRAQGSDVPACLLLGARTVPEPAPLTSCIRDRHLSARSACFVDWSQIFGEHEAFTCGSTLRSHTV